MSVGPAGSGSSFGRWGTQGPGSANGRYAPTLSVVAESPLPSAAPAAGPKRAYPVEPHVLSPNDPLNRYLTSGDRATFMNEYGVDLRPDGDILTPVSMQVDQTQAVLAAAGKIAADRADSAGSAVPDAGVTPGYLRGLVQGFQDRIAQGLPLFADDTEKANIDLQA